MSARGRPFLRERQGKVQKQCRLQRSGQHLAPVDRPVEGVEFARVIERVQNKRGQAKDVKVRGARSRPPPEQDIQADGKVYQRNQPQSLVLGCGRRPPDTTDAWMGTPERIQQSSPPAARHRRQPIAGSGKRCAESERLLAAVEQSPALMPARSPGPSFSTRCAFEAAGGFDPVHRVGGQGKRAFFGKIQGSKNCSR